MQSNKASFLSDRINIFPAWRQQIFGFRSRQAYNKESKLLAKQ